jgi:NTE family protein
MKRADPGHSGRRRLVLSGLGALPGWLAAGHPALGAPAAVGADAAPGSRERPLALALGSGTAHGHAHVGVMRVFEANGVRPDLIVGTSVGAIVGALWAAGLRAAEVESAARRFGLLSAARPAWPRLGLLSNDGLSDALRRLLPTPAIESWPIAFAAVATDFATGERVILDRGDGASAVAASACMPVLFEPVERDGRRLVDGALVEPVPVRAARWLGGRRVVGVDIAFRPHDEPVRHVVDAGFQTVHILVNRLIAEQIGAADVAVRLELHQLMRSRRPYAEALTEAGETAVRKQWARIAP